MKKVMLVLALLMVMCCFVAIAEEDNSWRTAPVITRAYEISSGKLYIEWEGNAPVYQVYLDGSSVASVVVNNAVIDIKKGTHTILVYPIVEDKAANTTLEVDFDIIGASLDVDLAMLGIDPKSLTAGTPSEPLYIDYAPDSVYAAVPENLTATTDFDDRVILSFTDRYYADEYVIAIKIGKDISYVRFSMLSEETSAFITKKGTTVTIVLDPEFLQGQECMVPELGGKYTFTVQLRKYAKDLMSGNRVETVVHESKTSKGCTYTPVAAWKTAPVISYASQTADGQISLQWTHDDNGLGCEYAVMRVRKTLGIRSGLEEIGVTADKAFVVDDLLNGSYSYVIIPRFAGESGEESEQITVEVRNDWVVAPVITCVQSGSNQVALTWTAAEGVESYHITVFTGDNNSVLRFVNLDFTQYAEYDVQVTGSEVQFVFTYDEEIDPELGEKVKFAVYGIRRTAGGAEQKTATTTQIMIIRMSEETDE